MADRTRFARLHALGRRLGLDHDGLQAAMRVRWPDKSSLTGLAPAELAEFERTLKAGVCDEMPPCPAPRPKRRLPRLAEGVTRMITPAQIRRINELFLELGWNQGHASGFLTSHFGVERVEDLATTARASQAMNRLIGFRRGRQRKARLQAAM